MYQLETIIENSYRDFHAKGMDYICLERDDEKTVKLYFFDGDATRLPEVVNPHDHRYDFSTEVLAGELRDLRYIHHPDGDAFQSFEWRTPLNGGDGFRWSSEVCLLNHEINVVQTHCILATRHDQLHTIRIASNETVLRLVQYDDVVPFDQPTTTFIRGDSHEPPPLAGLYRRWTKDALADRLRTLAIEFE
jgi:hypothetical protein